MACYGMDRLVNMMQGVTLHAVHTWVVFFTGQIIMRLLQRVDGIMQTTTAVRMGVAVLGMVHILADVLSNLHDDLRGAVDFLDRMLLTMPHFPTIARTMSDEPFSLIQICCCMGIEWMTAWLISMCRERGNGR